MLELATSSFILNSKSCLCSLLILLNICRESLYEPLEGLHLHILCSHSLELLQMFKLSEIFHSDICFCWSWNASMCEEMSLEEIWHAVLIFDKSFACRRPFDMHTHAKKVNFLQKQIVHVMWLERVTWNLDIYLTIFHEFVFWFV